MANLIGQSLGRYHILEQLGEGGMATVYKAYDTRLETDVAVKVIRTDALPQNAVERTLKRFEREAKSLARLTHPNIVKVMDYGEHDGAPYLVLVYLPGGTLKKRMGQRMPWQEAVRLLIPIANALDYAHEQKVVHRDVKPANILLTEKGQPMLTDFGIAKILEMEDGHTLTGTGMGIGTPEYMSPEQGMGREVDGRTDIYSMGIILYELITGRKPYTADTPMAVVVKHMTDPLPRPSQFVADLPEAVEKVLIKSLAKDPKDRYPDAGAFVTAMENLLMATSQKPASAPSVRKPNGPNLDETQDTYLQEETNTTKLQTGMYTEAPRKTRSTQTIDPPERPQPKKTNWWPWAIGLGVIGILLYMGFRENGGYRVAATEVPAIVEVPAAATEAPAQQTTKTQLPVAPVDTNPDSVTPEPIFPLPSWASFNVPHPILSDWRVRRAIAYCTNRMGLIQSVYPLLTNEEQQSLAVSSFVPKWHWLYPGDEDVFIYPYDVEKGKSLLEEAGWNLSNGSTYRVNANGDELALTLTTTTASFRQTWTPVWESQMMDCGIRLTRNHVQASWFFGDDTGLSRRDFEIAVFAWVSDYSYSGTSVYTCEQIPFSENNWSGQNTLGWCNQSASQSIAKGDTSFSISDRVAAYQAAQWEFTKDVPSIPLFTRISTFAFNASLQGVDLKPNNDYYTWNINEWEIPGKDTIIIGMDTAYESLSLSPLSGDYFAELISTMINGRSYITPNSKAEPLLQKKLSTIENGMAETHEVIVGAGDKVIDAYGSIVDLQAGIRLVDTTGNEFDYTGGTAIMNQLQVRYEFISGLSFSDNTPVSQTDFELYYRIACDPNSGAGNIAYICDQVETIEFTSNGYVVTWLPGYQNSTYYLAPFGFYPSQQTLSDGRLLMDVQTDEWGAISEVNETPLGAGPYIVKEWIKGDSIILEANRYYITGVPKTPTIIIKFIPSENIVSALLNGEINFIGSETLTGVDEALRTAESAGVIKILVLPSPTWEHIDFGLFVNP